VLEDTPVSALGDWEAFGTVVERWPRGIDAALIRVDADMQDQVDPELPGWGGASDLEDDEPARGLHYGWGWATWQSHESRCRAGSTVHWGSTTWWIDSTGGGGDSGSAVVAADGQALGILTWGRDITYEPVGNAFLAEQLGGYRFGLALDALSQASGLDLSLVGGQPADEFVDTPTDLEVCPLELSGG